jgi:hypothetical protein
MLYQLDEGYVGLGHDGQRWAIHDQNGRIVASRADIAASDHAGARTWLLDVLTTVAAVPEGTGDAAVSYVLEATPEGTVAKPVGSFHFDGQGWVVTDEHGRVVHRNDMLTEDDYDDAVDWADGIFKSRPGRRWRWRFQIGRFPDGTYGDVHGRLGRQRGRRAWNWCLDRLRIV